MLDSNQVFNFWAEYLTVYLNASMWNRPFDSCNCNQMRLHWRTETSLKEILKKWKMTKPSLNAVALCLAFFTLNNFWWIIIDGSAWGPGMSLLPTLGHFRVPAPIYLFNHRVRKVMIYSTNVTSLFILQRLAWKSSFSFYEPWINLLAIISAQIYHLSITEWPYENILLFRNI